MAKIYACVLLLAALVATCSAAPKGLYNCAGAQQLGKSASDNRCCQLCACIGNQSGNKAMQSDGVQKLCKQQCSSCVAAARDSKLCPKADSPLPETCSKGMQYNAMVKGLVDKCVSMYERDASALRLAKGC